MSKIEVEFAFEIGDFVYFKSAPHFDWKNPRKFVVVERLAQQCHGGIQRMYRLGGLVDDASRTLMNVSETELSREKPPYEPISEEWIQDRIRWEETRYAGHPWKRKLDEITPKSESEESEAS